ncbi:Ni/Fe-hydrogenase, b-type cytochrome subunit [Paraburkholderia sp. JPY432]|uniref:Ni/Fe-hydrogenase, b-type cytochrome subunit n=1 Tax=Paraburkholderia youngii TaxID=2782701 RepID=UPI001C3E18CC|nr:Ni/Fe-hydrogenase, b-type cytochrome subunit [Paraburkholderia youngii]
MTMQSYSRREKAADFVSSTEAIYVYEAPVRVWHWLNAVSIVVLALTGYFIGAPLLTQPGEASTNFLMGYIRFMHFTAAYLFAIGLAGRAYWAIVGNRHAREMFWVPVFSREYWMDMLTMLRYYSFLGPTPRQFSGHNPLSRFAMFFVFLLISLFMIVTGFALYGEGAQAGSWQQIAFGQVSTLIGQSQTVHTWHRLAMWVIMMFVIVHVYMAIREDIMARQNMVGTMISGYRTFRK